MKNNGSDSSYSFALLSTLSDDLTLPLVQIKTTLELLELDRLNARQSDLVRSLGLSAEAGLQLVEAYRLAMSLADTAELPLEPVSIGLVLNSSAHQLESIAKQYNTELWVDSQTHMPPVLAHQASLVTAFSCLGASLIRAQSATSSDKGRVLFGAHRHPNGQIVAGVYSSANGVSKRALQAARSLQGRARRPLIGMPAGTASGVLVADMLCARIWRPLSTSRYHNLDGLTTLVPISNQLNLV